MENSKKPVANPSVSLREEFDDWAILFNPDADLGHNGFGLNPTGVYLWRLLDGERSIDDMVTALRRDAADVPEEAGEQVLAFVEELTQHGLVACDVEEFYDGRERVLPRPTSVAENLLHGGHKAGQPGSGMLRYERPRLELFTLERRAHGNCLPTGSGASGNGNYQPECSNGNNAKDTSSWIGCGTGTHATETVGGGYGCSGGSSAQNTAGGTGCHTGTSAS